MRKKLWPVGLCAALLFVCHVAVSAKEPEKIVKNTVASGGKQRTYYLFVPAAVKAEKPAPLLVLLHGSGRNGRVLIEHWQKLAEQEGIILAGPDSRNSTSWTIPEDGPQFLYDLVEELKAKQPIDPRRVYLFGHSAGAVFGLFMAALESEYFAAAAVSAGAMKKGNFPLLDEAERKVPVALFVGTRDPFFPLTDVRTTRDAFAERGYTVELTEVVGLDHNYYSRSSDINAKSWEFLKKYQLAADAKYKEHNFKFN
ncbi:MAG TPA: alpha/beta fold hydrolase [Pyrinomonadaceae bacterium]|nr:alpha/beta fold hydrolase [Pyrinomonadaceae bacterium]